MQNTQNTITGKTLSDVEQERDALRAALEALISAVSNKEMLPVKERWYADELKAAQALLSARGVR